MKILATFRSRAQCLDFAERLTKYGVTSDTVAAPKEAKIGCGLCVRFDVSAYPRAQAVLKLGKYSAFAGFYRIDFSGGRMTVVPYLPPRKQ